MDIYTDNHMHGMQSEQLSVSLYITPPSHDLLYYLPFCTCINKGHYFVAMHLHQTCMLMVAEVCCTKVSCSLQLFCSPYTVVLDHAKKAVVVAIRGTLSVEVGGTSVATQLV